MPLRAPSAKTGNLPRRPFAMTLPPRPFCTGMTSRLCALLLVGWCFGIGSASGQSASVTVQASVHATEIGLYETMAYTLRVEGARRGAIDTPEPPATTNLVLRQTTPSTRSITLRHNGETLPVVTFEWRYDPRQVGVAQIRPVTVTINGTAYRTAPIQVDVIPQSQRPSTAPSAPPIAPPSSRSSPQPESTLGSQDLFIEVEPSATEVYQNEGVTVAYRLFFQSGIQLRHSRLAQAWDANGFWREELDVAARPRPTTRVRNGTTYQTIVLKRAALFPTRAGELPIDPLRIRTEAAKTNATQTGRGGRFEPITLASDPLTIDARPLPAQAPPAFEGAVGQFEMDADLSSDTVSVDDDVRLRVRLRGTGNMATIQPPSLAAPAAFDVYDPTVTTTFDRTSRRVRGTTTFTYTLVPTTPGRHVVPSLAFAYFNPASGTYETLQTEARSVRVTGAAPSRTATVSNATPAARPRGVTTDSSETGYGWLWAGLPLVGVLLAAAGWWAYRQQTGPPEEAVASATGRHGSQAPMHTAQRHLARAHHHLREGAVKPFYQSVERAVLAFVGGRLQRSARGLTQAAMDRLLARHEVPRAQREALHELLEAAHQAQFTPSHPSHDSMEAALNQAQDLVLHLDRALPQSVETTPLPDAPPDAASNASNP